MVHSSPCQTPQFWDITLHNHTDLQSLYLLPTLRFTLSFCRLSAELRAAWAITALIDFWRRRLLPAPPLPLLCSTCYSLWEVRTSLFFNQLGLNEALRRGRLITFDLQRELQQQIADSFCSQCYHRAIFDTSFAYARRLHHLGNEQRLQK